MPIIFWIWITIISLLLLCIIVLQLVVYGMDLGSGFCESWVDYIRKSHKYGKEWKEEQRAKKTFIKLHPLCVECQKQGKYRLAKHCNQDGVELIPVCKEHYVSMIDRHHKEKEDAVRKV